MAMSIAVVMPTPETISGARGSRGRSPARKACDAIDPAFIMGVANDEQLAWSRSTGERGLAAGFRGFCLLLGAALFWGAARCHIVRCGLA